MKTRYFAMLTTLAFLGFSVPAAAHPCERDPGHKHCTVEDPQTTFTVNVEVGSNITDPPAFCTGITVTKLSLRFPATACAVTLTDEFFGTRDYCLCAVSVRNTKKKTDVQLNFHHPCGVLHCGADAWHTPSLPATIVVGPPGDFTITVDAPNNVELTKINNPGKGTTLTNRIFVGPLDYTRD